VRITETESECPLATASRSPAGLNAICDGARPTGTSRIFPVFTSRTLRLPGLGGAGDGVRQDHRAGGGRGGLAVVGAAAARLVTNTRSPSPHAEGREAGRYLLLDAARLRIDYGQRVIAAERDVRGLAVGCEGDAVGTGWPLSSMRTGSPGLPNSSRGAIRIASVRAAGSLTGPEFAVARTEGDSRVGGAMSGHLAEPGTGVWDRAATARACSHCENRCCESKVISTGRPGSW